MKSTFRRFLAVLMAVAMLWTTMVPALSEEELLNSGEEEAVVVEYEGDLPLDDEENTVTSAAAATVVKEEPTDTEDDTDTEDNTDTPDEADQPETTGDVVDAVAVEDLDEVVVCDTEALFTSFEAADGLMEEEEELVVEPAEEEAVSFEAMNATSDGDYKSDNFKVELISVPKYGYIYDGSARTPKVEVTHYQGSNVTPYTCKDFSVQYIKDDGHVVENPTDVGTYHVYIVPDANSDEMKGFRKELHALSFSIIEHLTVTVKSGLDKVYGDAVTSQANYCGITVKIGNLVVDDYDRKQITVTCDGFAENANVGQYDIGIKEDVITIGGYTYQMMIDENQQQFEVKQRPVKVAFWGESTEFVYDGAEHSLTPGLTWIDNAEKVLTKDVHYTYDGKGTDADNYEATVSLIGDNYAFADGTKVAKKTFKITPATVSVTWAEPMSFVYDGREHAPTATVKCGNVALPETDYTVNGKQKNASDASYTAEVVLNNGNYTLATDTNRTCTFTITRRPVTVPTITAENKVYDGTTTAMLTADSLALGNVVEGDDVDVEVEGAFADKNAGENKPVTITLALVGTQAGNYNLEQTTQTTTATITPVQLTVTARSYSIEYGSKVPELEYDWEPELCVDDNPADVFDGALKVVKQNDSDADLTKLEVKDSPFRIINDTLINASKAKNGNYEISKVTPGTLTITPKKIIIPESFVTLDPTTYTYDSNEHKPTVTVMDGDKNIIAEDQYKLDYIGSTVDAGTVQLVLSGANRDINYVMEFQKPIMTYTIEPAELDILWSDTVKTYNGSTQAPTAELTGILPGDKVKWKVVGGQVEPGTYEAHVEFVGNVTNYKLPEDNSVVYTINSLKLNDVTVEVNPGSYLFDGTPKQPGVTVYSGDMIVPESEYRVSYVNNVQPGTATAVVTDAPGGRYVVSGKGNFSILARNITGMLLARAESGTDHSFTLSWTPVTDVDGYDLFFSKCNDKLRNYVRKLEATVGNDVTRYTFNNLQDGKCYKASVKAWVMRNGEKVYVKESYVVHCIVGGKSKKYTNPIGLSLNRRAKTLAVGKSFKIKAKAIKKYRRLKLLDHATSARYFSTDPTVATVNRKGKVKAVGAGVCQIYVYTANGIWKTVTITVK